VSATSPGQGKGSTFEVKLPTLEIASAPKENVAPTNELLHVGTQRRILVVDDNCDSANTLAMMLTLTGNEVRTVHDGIEAIEAAAEFRPKAILMDLGMPKLNGYDATQHIREQSWGRDMIIIALTGWGQEADRAQSKKAGCDGHLVKPVNLSDLRDLLTELESTHGS
jgi:CheY-like chemotaxis protein